MKNNYYAYLGVLLATLYMFPPANANSEQQYPIPPVAAPAPVVQQEIPNLLQELDGALSQVIPNAWNEVPKASVQFGPPEALMVPPEVWEPSLLSMLEEKARAAEAQKRAKTLREAPYYRYGTTVVPALHAVGSALFDTPLDPKMDMGRVSNLLRAKYTHTHTQPAGWEELVEAVRSERIERGEEPAARLANSLINQIPYVDGTDGTFFAPARLFSRGGVCKDYVTTKYLLLKEAGFSEEDLRIVVVAPSAHAPERSNAHVVLALRIQRTAWILDMAPSHSLNQDIRQVDKDVRTRVKILTNTGIQRRHYIEQLDNMVPAEQFHTTYFGRNRGLEWVGNTQGGAYFGRPANDQVKVVSFSSEGANT